MSHLFIAAILFGILICVLLLWASISSLKRRRLLEDLPTSKTTGVFIGLVELKGTAEAETPLICHLSEKRCVWYSWNVQEHWSRTVTETYFNKDGKPQTRTRTESGWTTVASGGQAISFYLQDELGAVRVNPQNAEIHSQNVFHYTCSNYDPFYYKKGPANEIANSTGRRSFSEQAILLHQPLYVVGKSRERDDCVAAEIAYDSSSPIFLISTSTEESHRESGLWKFGCFGLLFVLLPTLAAFLLFHYEHEIYREINGGDYYFISNEINPYHAIAIPSAIGVFALLIWGICWFWTVYNSLIGLKNRVKMAAANIDVELKRRYDLIPQILRVIEGMQKHEREIQETAAQLRGQARIDTVENRGDSVVHGCANSVKILIERYPELKSDELFLSLHHNLVETEQRIALARGYYNDVIETYNNRRERFPENLISAAAQLHPIPPFLAENFELAAIDVHFAE